MRLKRRTRAAGGIAGSILFLTACSSPTPAPPPASPQAQELWGEIQPIVSVKELMRDLIDPASDNVFDAVGTTLAKNHRVEVAPKTERDWDKVRTGAVTMAEGASLLKVPRAFAPAGDLNDSAGPEPVELSPDQTVAKVNADRVLWNAKIEVLRDVCLEVLDIVRKKDVDALWAAEEDLDQACENCHLEYWYPGERALMPKLDRRLEELYGTEMNRSGRHSAHIGMEPLK